MFIKNDFLFFSLSTKLLQNYYKTEEEDFFIYFTVNNQNFILLLKYIESMFRRVLIRRV